MSRTQKIGENRRYCYRKMGLVLRETGLVPLQSRPGAAAVKVVGVGRTTRNDAYRSAFDDFLMLSAVGVVPNHVECEIESLSARSGIECETFVLTIECACEAANEQGWCDASSFVQLVRKRNSPFAYKDYGCKNLTEFVRKSGLPDISKSGGVMLLCLRSA